MVHRIPLDEMHCANLQNSVTTANFGIANLASTMDTPRIFSGPTKRIGCATLSEPGCIASTVALLRLLHHNLYRII